MVILYFVTFVDFNFPYIGIEGCFDGYDVRVYMGEVLLELCFSSFLKGDRMDYETEGYWEVEVDTLQ